MSDKHRREIALSIFLNEQLLTVLSLALPNEKQNFSKGGTPPQSNNDPLAGNPEVVGKPIPLAVHLVGDLAAIEAIRRAAMKQVEITINLQAESGSGSEQTFAFNGHEIKHISSSSSNPFLSTTSHTYDAIGRLISVIGSSGKTTFFQSPEPPVDPPTIVE